MTTTGDELAEALLSIEEILEANPLGSDDELRTDIDWLLDRLRELSAFLDDPTGVLARPNFKERFGAKGAEDAE